MIIEKHEYLLIVCMCDFGFGGQGACVQNVLDSVISALLDDKNRKFIYVEMVYYFCLFFYL